MRNNCFIFFLPVLSGVLLFSCAKPDRKNTETTTIDSLVTVLQPASFNVPDSVIQVCNNLLPITEEEENKAKLLLVLASSYELMGSYDTAISLSKRGIELSKNNTQLNAKLYNELGVCYEYKGDYKEALENYQLAQQFYVEVKDTAGYIREHNNVGLIYQNVGDFARAKQYFTECLELNRKKNNKDIEIMALSNLGWVEMELGEFDSALKHYQIVLQSDLRTNNESYIASSYHNVGEAFKNMRQFDSAAPYLTKAIALKEKLGLKGSLTNSYKQYAELLIETNDLNKGEQYLNKAFAYARETGTTDYLKECFELQSRLAAKRGDFKTAYIAADSFHTIEDSISNFRFRSELVIKEKDHELATKEKLRQQEIKEFENEKITFILSTVFFIGLIVFLFFLLKKQKRLIKQLEIQKSQIEEGLAVRTQLLSFLAHEIRNPLGGIMGLTDLLLGDQPTPAQKELLDYQKKASVHLLSLMNDLLDYQKLGSGKVELNSIRFNLRDVLYQVYALYQGEIREKKLNYELNYDETIPAALMGDPIRLTQIFSNLLNNAIKFTDKGTVAISATKFEQTATQVSIFCRVSDSGVGIPTEEQEKIFELYVQSSKNKSDQLGTGLGLSIVKNILSLMNSKIELQSKPGMGTSFSFTITFKLPK